MKKSVLYLLCFCMLLSCNSSNLSDNSESEKSCPFGFSKMKSSGQTIVSEGNTNRNWWPEQLDLSVLRQNSSLSNPMDDNFNYKKEFESIDFNSLKKDIEMVLTDSKDWWPADYGNYGPFFIRMAWHSAGTYRTGDGRGGSRAGQLRFAPLNSWPDNGNLDKARRLLWPVKQKYGLKISWADLMILAGNVALESMGFETIGFAAGREDVWEPESNVYWGSETEFLDQKRYSDERELEMPLAAVQMGLIYVNPEGPDGNPDPKLAAIDIRETFGRMGMNDEETVALIAGGHTLGKTHGASSGDHLGASPEGAKIEQQGIGWNSDYQSGKGKDAITSGLEVIWTEQPTKWSHGYFESLFENEWELTKSPGGANQWVAKTAHKMFPDPFDDDVIHKPTMLTTDLSLIEDSAYLVISKKFYENPELFELAFAKAWFKLTHRDMGPKSTYLGPEIPEDDFLWQDPIPKRDHPLVNGKHIHQLKNEILKSGLSISELVSTAWASASTFRKSDRRGGANGARVCLLPQVDWECNYPDQLKKVIDVYKSIQASFNSKHKPTKISIADLIIIGGNVGVENAVVKAGYEISLPFYAGRMDATQDKTDADGIAVLEPISDGFRNYHKKEYTLSEEQLLIDKAQQLCLSAPEMTVLVGGLRALSANFDASNLGVLTDKPETLTNDFFVNLLDMNTKWKPTDSTEKLFIGIDRASEEVKWTATRVDLIFGSNSELRALAEVYASYNAQEKFINDFADAWVKVCNLDRFDINLQ